MTARCGSNDPAHRVKQCRACDHIYKLRYKNGAPRYRIRARANSAQCAICGITAGNSADVPVYRYPLKRWFSRKMRWIGSVGLCDPCIVATAELRPEFRRAA